MRGFLKVLAVSTVVAVAALEITLTVYDRRQDARRNASPEPSYTGSIYATDGQRKLSAGDGPLKLKLDPVVGYRNFPNLSAPWFRTNLRGYRGDELRPDGAAKRIVLVGGSAAFGAGARSDRDTVAQRLEQKLGNVEGINAAVIGHTTLNELQMLESELLALGPSLIVAFDGYNDAFGHVSMGGEQIYSEISRQLEDRMAEIHRLRINPLWAVAAAGRSLFPHLGRRYWMLPRVRDWMLGRRAATPEWDLAPRVRVYTRNLKRMAHLARENRAGFLVLLQPNRPPPGSSWSGDDFYARFVESAARVLEAEGVAFLNLHASPALDSAHFTDNFHLKEAGAEVVAQMAAERVRALMLP